MLAFISFLYKLLLPLIEHRIKHQMESLISDNITQAINYLEQNIFKVQCRLIEKQERDSIPEPKNKEKLKLKEPWQSEAFGSEI
jgi:ATP adenylyltransferase/5',5'''-P-1,P-4-tetraphosphate phosphorylase II